MVIHFISATFVDIFGAWTAFYEIFRGYKYMASFMERDEGNVDQENKNLSASCNRYRDNPRKNDDPMGLIIKDISCSNYLKTNDDIHPSFSDSM